MTQEGWMSDTAGGDTITGVNDESIHVATQGIELSNGTDNRTVDDNGTVAVVTTTPIPPPIAVREPIYTPRLMLRPLRVDANAAYGRDGDEDDDVRAFNIVRNQQSVMRWMMGGVVTESLEQTRDILRRFVEPRDMETFAWAVVLRDKLEGRSGMNGGAALGGGLTNRLDGAGGAVGASDGSGHIPEPPSARQQSETLEAGTVIGMVGGMNLNGPEGWPKLGYLLREDTWGSGLASEAVRAYLTAYWALPRKALRVEVAKATIRGASPNAAGWVAERLIGVTKADNAASRRILERMGMERYQEVIDPTRKGGRLAKFRLVRSVESRSVTAA